MSRPLASLALIILAAGCDPSEPLAPDPLSAEPAGAVLIPAIAPTGGWTSSVVWNELDLVANVFQGTGAGGGINESGMIAGTIQGYFDGLFVDTYRAATWTGASPTVLPTLAPGSSQAATMGHDINDAGVVAGVAKGAATLGCCGPYQAVIWPTVSTIAALAPLSEGGRTWASAINNPGWVAGWAHDAQGTQHAVLWKGAGQAPVDLGTFGGDWSSATDVNDAGQVVGAFVSGGVSTGFRWTEGGATDLLPDLGGGYVMPHAINSAGTVVGSAIVGDGSSHAFRWTQSGGAQDLGIPPVAGAVASWATAINDAGQIVVTTLIDDGSYGVPLYQAWLWADGSWFSLHDASLGWTTGSGINEGLVVSGSLLNGSSAFGRAARWSVTLAPEVEPWPFTGFFAPVDNAPALNQVKAGSAIPVKFSLGGNRGLAIFASGYPVSQPIGCSGSAPLAPVEQTLTAGSSSLSYDGTLDQYVYVWKTERAWAGSCRRLAVRLADGSERWADFWFSR